MSERDDRLDVITKPQTMLIPGSDSPFDVNLANSLWENIQEKIDLLARTVFDDLHLKPIPNGVTNVTGLEDSGKYQITPDSALSGLPTGITTGILELSLNKDGTQRHYTLINSERRLFYKLNNSNWFEPDLSARAEFITSSRTISNIGTYLLDYNGGDFIVTMPSSPRSGDKFHFIVTGGDVETIKPHINVNGKNLEGLANGTVQIDVNYSQFTLTYIDNGFGYSVTV